MQKYSVSNDPDERCVVRRWRFYLLAIYGSIASVLLLLSILSDRPTQVAGNTERPVTRIIAAR